VLYDYMQEVSRLPKALTILPLAPVPNVDMVVTGSFAGLPDALLKLVQPGLKFPPSGEGTIAEVLSVEGSEPAALRIRAGENIINVPMTGASQLKATLRVRCYTASDPDGTLRCLVPGPRQAAPVAPDSNLTLAGPQGWMNFQIAEVRAGAK
jgi:hypothetical protein